MVSIQVSDRVNQLARVTLLEQRRPRINKGLPKYYAMVHKKSTPYYPQANGLAESTKKTLQMILKKIVNKDHTDWDKKLNSALSTYYITSYKTTIQSTLV